MSAARSEKRGAIRTRLLGELLVGIGLGNLVPPLVGGASVEIVAANPVLRFWAELGVLILLFEVGLESDLRALVRVGLSALLGAVAPSRSAGGERPGCSRR